MFQPKAWCDENVMKVWVEREWVNMFTNPSRANSSGKILVADVHRAQHCNQQKLITDINFLPSINLADFETQISLCI